MSFFYPNRIRISRPVVETQLGVQDYKDERPRKERTILFNQAASIQLNKQGPPPGAQLPADMLHRTLWRILLPMGAVAKGAIERADVVTDELKNRYAVVGSYLTALNAYELYCERLEN